MRAAAKRIAYIDGLRAIAVLSVLAFHVRAPGLQQPLFPYGSHGVELFFVLSGFCLSYPTLLKLRDGPMQFGLAEFFSRRFIRIVPPYWIAIALFFILSPRFPIFDVLRQAFFYDRNVRWLNGSFWSLAVEFRWYFIFPIALWFWVRARNVFALMLVGVIVLADATSAIDVLVLPAFLSGIVAAEIRIHRHWIGRYALLAFLILLPVLVRFSPVGNFTYIDRSWEAAAFLLVVACGATPALERLLSLRPLETIGIASYSIYLVHGPVIQALQENGTASWIAAAVGLSAGFTFWYFCERPFVGGKLRDFLVGNVSQTLRRMFARVSLPCNYALTNPSLTCTPHSRITTSDALHGIPLKSGFLERATELLR
jgi:peptidoglycan/LPS O-acetylase OafA/YrhL